MDIQQIGQEFLSVAAPENVWGCKVQRPVLRPRLEYRQLGRFAAKSKVFRQVDFDQHSGLTLAQSLPPHPSPLPWGEGEPFAALRVIERSRPADWGLRRAEFGLMLDFCK